MLIFLLYPIGVPGFGSHLLTLRDELRTLRIPSAKQQHSAKKREGFQSTDQSWFQFLITLSQKLKEQVSNETFVENLMPKSEASWTEQNQVETRIKTTK